MRAWDWEQGCKKFGMFMWLRLVLGVQNAVIDYDAGSRETIIVQYGLGKIIQFYL